MPRLESPRIAPDLGPDFAALRAKPRWIEARGWISGEKKGVIGPGGWCFP
jgi:hypothetical protein